MPHPSYNFFRWDYWFGQVDSRPLSLFRILFGAILLKEAIYRMFIPRLFFSDEGVLPRYVLDSLNRPPHFSLMDAIKYPWLAEAFIVFSAVVAVCLMFGYRTRLMVILNFIIILSIHERNPFILNGGDVVQRLLSFWMMFLPLGDYYSLDAIRRRRGRYLVSGRLEDLRVESSPHTTFALPLRVLQLQIAFVYLFTFFVKLTGESWRSGEATFYSLQVQSLMLPSAEWVLRHIPLWMLEANTYATLFIEGTFFIFVFSPIFQPFLRKFALLGGTLLHIGIAVLMAIPTFSLTMIVSYITFFEPQWFMPKPSRPKDTLAPIPPDHPLWLLLAMTDDRQIDIAPEGISPDLNDRQTWKTLCGHLPLSRYWVWLLDFGFIRTAILWLIHAYRPSQLWIEQPVNSRLQIIRQTMLAGILGSLIFFVTWWNIQSIRIDGEAVLRRVPHPADEVLMYIGLDQSWYLFAPTPSTIDGWVRVPGQFADGTSYDLFTGKPLDDEMLRWYWGPHVRWRKYTVNARNNPILLGAWADYYCRRYNSEREQSPEKRLVSLQLEYMYFRSYAPGETRAPVQRRLLYEYTCPRPRSSA